MNMGMMHMMHKMGQVADVMTMGGFMNPTKQGLRDGLRMGMRKMVRKNVMGQNKDHGVHANMGMGNMGSMRQNQNHAHMGKMGSMRQNQNHAHMGKMKGLIPAARRRLGDACLGLTGRPLGRCRTKIKGGCLGLMGHALNACKSQRHKLRKRALGGAWVLIKKSNGQCECTQAARGEIVVGRFRSFKECEDHRSHDC